MAHDLLLAPSVHNPLRDEGHLVLPAHAEGGPRVVQQGGHDHWRVRGFDLQQAEGKCSPCASAPDREESCQEGSSGEAHSGQPIPPECHQARCLSASTALVISGPRQARNARRADPRPISSRPRALSVASGRKRQRRPHSHAPIVVCPSVRTPWQPGIMSRRYHPDRPQTCCMKQHLAETDPRIRCDPLRGTGRVSVPKDPRNYEEEARTATASSSPTFALDIEQCLYTLYMIVR